MTTATLATTPHTAARLKLAQPCRSISCPSCGQTTATHRVIDDQHPHTGPEPDLRIAISRRFYCHHCKHVVVWIEALDNQLRLTGEIISGPALIKNPSDVRRFLHDHPIAKWELTR